MPFLRTEGKRDHAARARGRAGGGAMFLGMGDENLGVKPSIFFFPTHDAHRPTSGSQNEHREQVTRIIGWELLRVILVPFSLLRYVTLTYCSDSLTLVSVFSLFTYCDKYRIYFSILERVIPGTTCYDI